MNTQWELSNVFNIEMSFIDFCCNDYTHSGKIFYEPNTDVDLFFCLSTNFFCEVFGIIATKREIIFTKYFSISTQIWPLNPSVYCLA